MDLKPAFQGNFGAVSVARLLLRLSVAGETGAIKIAEPTGIPTVILLRSGEIFDLTSARNDISLHASIGDSGVAFTLSDREKKLKNHDLLASLISGSKLKEREAKTIFHDFLIESISRLLATSAGNYSFFRLPLEPGAATSNFRFGIPETILEASRYVAGRGEIGVLVPGWEAASIVPLGSRHLAVEKFKPDDFEKRLFDLCAAGGSLKDIIAKIAPNEKLAKGLALAFVYVMAQAEILTIATAREQPTREQPTKVQPVMAMEPPKPEPAKAEQPKQQATTAQSRQKAADQGKPPEILELEAERNRLALLDPFQKLGVNRSAGNDEIRKNYLKLAKTYHPDTTPQGSGQNYKILKDSIFAMLSDAFKTIESEEKRAAFLKSEADGPDAAGMVRKIFAAEELVTKARLFVKNGRDIPEAFKLAEQARMLNPGDPEVRIIYFWTLWLVKSTSGDRSMVDTVVEELRRALKERTTADGWLYLGLIHNTTGDYEHAMDAFKQVLRIDPKNHMASIHLKLLEKRGMG